MASIRYFPDNFPCTRRELIMVALSDLVLNFSIVNLHSKHAMLLLRRPHLRVFIKSYQSYSTLDAFRINLITWFSRSAYPLLSTQQHFSLCSLRNIPCLSVCPSSSWNAFRYQRVVCMDSETFLVRAVIRLNRESRLHMTFRDLSTPVPSV